MNPAALKTNIADLKRGGILIVNEDEFDTSNLDKAGYETNPLDDGSVSQVRRAPGADDAPDARRRRRAWACRTKEADRCKNFFALGLVYWLYERDREPTEAMDQGQVREEPEVSAKPTCGPCKAGYNYGDSTESFAEHYQRRQGQAARRQVSQDHRQRSDRLGPGRRRPSAAARTCSSAGYPITPPATFCTTCRDEELRRAHLPGRRRDRRHVGRLRRRLRRRARGHRHQRPRHLPQGRGDGPGRHDRTADGHHRRAARRPEHRPADQDRAIRPAAGHVRPQRRLPGADRRRRPRPATASTWCRKRSASPSSS